MVSEVVSVIMHLSKFYPECVCVGGGDTGGISKNTWELDRIPRHGVGN